MPTFCACEHWILKSLDLHFWTIGLFLASVSHLSHLAHLAHQRHSLLLKRNNKHLNVSKMLKLLLFLILIIQKLIDVLLSLSQFCSNFCSKLMNVHIKYQEFGQIF